MKSKELREIEQEAMEQEPSLDKMFNLKDPKVLKGLGEIAKMIQDRKNSSTQ